MTAVADNNWHTKRERSSPGWIKIVIALYRLFGKRFCELLMYPIAGFFFLFDRNSRSASAQFLKTVRADCQQTPAERLRLYWLSYLHFCEFARSLLDKFAVWQGGVQFESLSFEGKERLRSMAHEKVGAIVLGAHLGNIEVLRSVGQDMKGHKINTLMFTEHNPGFNAVLQAMNPDFGFHIISTESSGPQLLLELQECLERGEMVAMLGDRKMPGSPEKSVPVEFFGREAQLPAGPFVLASLLECPVFLVFCFREGSGYHSYFELFEERVELPRRDRQEALFLIIGESRGCRRRSSGSVYNSSAAQSLPYCQKTLRALLDPDFDQRNNPSSLSSSCTCICTRTYSSS
jgi:predicted LPLAT superfamily acyltransferase